MEHCRQLTQSVRLDDDVVARRLRSSRRNPDGAHVSNLPMKLFFSQTAAPIFLPNILAPCSDVGTIGRRSESHEPWRSCGSESDSHTTKSRLKTPSLPVRE